jgi:kynurenine 3-monooxygenase
LELNIPVTSEDDFALNPDYIHLWPREKYILIGMPNTNKTFTCNLFFPKQGEISFATYNTPEKFEAFIKEQFPTAAKYMSDI